MLVAEAPSAPGWTIFVIADHSSSGITSVASVLSAVAWIVHRYGLEVVTEGWVVTHPRAFVANEPKDAVANV